MGNSSSSTVSQVNDVYVVNKSSIDIMNETNTNIVNNTIINIAKSASASSNASQDTTIGNISVGPGGTTTMAGIAQDQKAVLNFSSVQSSTVVTQSSAAIVNSMLQQITSSIDNSVLTKMIADAQATNKAAFLSPPLTSASSNTNTTNTTKLDSETFTKLSNVVNNCVTNNFSTSSVDACLSSLVAAQKLSIGSITNTGGTLNIGLLSQSQSLTLLSKCNQVSSAMNSISNNLVQDFNATIVEDKKNTSDTSMEGTAKSDNVATGLFEGLGSMFSGLFSGLTTLTGGILGSSALSSLCCCCCCILLIIILMVPKSGQK
jgi:hypothetical protein